MSIEVQILILAAVLGLLIITPWDRSRGARTFPDPTHEAPREVTTKPGGPTYVMSRQTWPGDPMRPDMAHMIIGGRHDASKCGCTTPDEEPTLNTRSDLP